MKISIDTKEDSHEEIRKVIKMLQNLVGDSQEIFINQPAQETVSPIANIFGDTSNLTQTSSSSETTQEAQGQSESTEDLFKELFNEEELKKMNEPEVKEEEEPEIKPKDKKYDIEFY